MVLLPVESMGFDLPTLRALTLGDGNIGVAAFSAFCSRTRELIAAVWATDRSNPPERQELKQEFVDLMREHVWVPTIACGIYVAIVFAGPRLVKSPWPVRTQAGSRAAAQVPAPATETKLRCRLPQVKPVLVLWNLLLSVFSAVGSYHCMGGLLANVRSVSS